MLRKRAAGAAGIGLIGLVTVLAGAASDLLPERMNEVSRLVEEVRGRKFMRSVPASELQPEELKKILRSKINDGIPAAPDDYLASLVALGLIDPAPNLLDRLVDFYSSQVIAFYDPQPRRFFVVKGAEAQTGGDEGLAKNLIFSHELMHALQDETLHLDERVKELKDDSDRSTALQCLLEGEATVVMVRVALKDIPGADDSVEDQLAPLMSAGSLERSNVPKDVPDYFVEQLFFPYVDGTEFVRAALKKGGWAEVDRFWRNPPQSTSEILHGAPYPAPATGLLSESDRTPPAGRRLTYADTLGEWTLRFLLERSLPKEEAAKAAEGWRGDRIAFFAGPRDTAYLWRIRFDGPATAARFEAALRAARAKRPPASPETITRAGADVVVEAKGGTGAPAGAATGGKY
ncbi:MAG TPA: hypothetical protein VH854_07880 [Thermoanaerobaculia bacterium]|nr:hypothetical protein [Thermoanaerobaculia bacterium]